MTRSHQDRSAPPGRWGAPSYRAAALALLGALAAAAAPSAGCGGVVVVDEPPPTSDDPCRPLVCADGVCEPHDAPDGTSCDYDHEGCTEDDACFGGKCQPGKNICTITLYANPEHQSPVHGDRGDLLLLAGNGFDLGQHYGVVYVANDKATPPSPPLSQVPSGQSASEGWIEPLAFDDHGISIRLPEAMTNGMSYALWVYKGDQNVSNRVLINDARPMWVSPAWVHATKGRPGINRILKVVGRNLSPRDALHPTQVRLRDQNGHTLPPLDIMSISPHFVEARLDDLPLQPAGITKYAVEVSRDDGDSWQVAGQPLVVRPDPPLEIPKFHPEAQGELCDPCVDTDHTLCVARAIRAAASYASPAGASVCQSDPECPSGFFCMSDGHCGRRAVVELGRGACGNGVWQLQQCATFVTSPAPSLTGRMDNGVEACGVGYGLVVPRGVSLIGPQHPDTGPPGGVVRAKVSFSQPILDAHAYDGTGFAWERQFMFRLDGDNEVSGLELADEVYGSQQEPGSSALFLNGHVATVTNNVFSGTYNGASTAITEQKKASALPGLQDVVVSRNTFASWSMPLGFIGLEDGIVAENIFFPGGIQGNDAIAIALYGEKRVDISSNIIDGEMSAYSRPLVGWRAAVSLPHASSHEHVLFAQNQISCVGSRPGVDGEAILFDNQGNVPPSSSSLDVEEAAEDHLVVPFPSPVTDPSILVGKWVTVNFGPGLGQSRKITAALPFGIGNEIFVAVAPRFEVPPAPGVSRVLIGTKTWQTSVFDNRIDNRCSIPCGKAGAPACDCDAHPCSGNDACLLGQCVDTSKLAYYNTGAVGLASAMTDVSIDDNRLFHTTGIALAAEHWAYTDFCSGCGLMHAPKYFVDIRHNEIDGVFGGGFLDDNRFGSGITIHGLSFTSDGLHHPIDNPAIPAFGVSIAHNQISEASVIKTAYSLESTAGIAIYAEQPSDQSDSPLCLDTLIFGNHIDGDGATKPVSAAIINGTPGSPPTPNAPLGTVVCGNDYSNFGGLLENFVPQGKEAILCP